MEKGFIRRAMAANKEGNLAKAARIMNEGLDFYADYMQKITMGIETYDAAILLHVLRPFACAPSLSCCLGKSSGCPTDFDVN